MTLLSIDLDYVTISLHARERFRRRFPGWDLEAAFHRSVPLAQREVWKLCPKSACEKPLLDPESGAIFICNRDRDKKVDFVCATVIESKT